jgi:MGT family glycosyltransferase
MAKYVFLNIPAWGHVNPTLAVVQELVRRRHDVSYYLTEEFRESIQATGAVFQPYASELANELEAGGTETWRMPAFLVKDMHSVPPQILDRVRAEQPDVIVYDFMCAWAHIVIDTLHVPAVGVRATYASNKQFSFLDGLRENMQNMSGMQEFIGRMKAFRVAQPGSSLDPQVELFKALVRVEQLNIIFMPKEFHPKAEAFDESYVFVGSSILPRHQHTDFPFDQLNNELPLLYISLGSVEANQPEFYKHCFEAFREQPWQVVLSVGKRTDLTQLGPFPANFLLSPYVPQLDILPHARVFVTHAGTNSLMESLYYGVPMVLIPQQPEQQMHARRAVELGLGVMLDKEAVTAATLSETVERVAQNAEYRERTQSMQRILSKAGGYQQAADAIIQFTQAEAKKPS